MITSTRYFVEFHSVYSRIYATFYKQPIPHELDFK